MAKKKGFMTPERKKKLRTLLRKKAVEELKKEQERKAAERIQTIGVRCGSKKDLVRPMTNGILLKLQRRLKVTSENDLRMWSKAIRLPSYSCNAQL